MRKTQRALVFALAAGAFLAAAVPSAAKFANPFRPVPLERLLANLGAYVEKNPKDAAGFYTLGRVHSLAFARDMETAQVKYDAGDASGLPSFPPWESVLQRPEPGKPLSDKGVRHLGASVKHYQTAVKLAPKEALYWLGLGWMTEQGIPNAARAAAPFATPAAVVPKAVWRQKALDAYRKAYGLALDKDLGARHRGPSGDDAISLEAAEGLIRLLDVPTATRMDQTELERLRGTVKRLNMLPRVVTPIVFPLDDSAPLEELLDPERSVTFDLAGDTRAERWPWVRPNAGILVWDPQRTGRITSGTQLFGSVTWSMFWRDGYAALAALDDDGDDRLSGKELRGLAVWQDRDTDGVSDPGEVQPLERLGVTAVSVRANGSHAGVPWNRQGLRFQDDTWRPTYDWTPTSVGR